jgi:hypothetical protein
MKMTVLEKYFVNRPGHTRTVADRGGRIDHGLPGAEVGPRGYDLA